MSDRDPVMLTVGRELLQATGGQIDLDIEKQELLLADDVETRLYLETSNKELSADLLQVFGERGYALRFHGQTEQAFTGYRWRVKVPEDVEEKFARYVELRGEAHPAPPKTKTSREYILNEWRRVSSPDYDEMEYLPHPVADREAFYDKLDAVGTTEMEHD